MHSYVGETSQIAQPCPYMWVSPRDWYTVMYYEDETWGIVHVYLNVVETHGTVYMYLYVGENVERYTVMHFRVSETAGKYTYIHVWIKSRERY